MGSTGSKRIGALLLSALVIAACNQPIAATGSTPPSASPTVAPTTAAVATVQPTDQPTSEPTPEPTTEPTEPTDWPCPTDSPVTVADVRYADRSCFGRDEIRVRAWLDRGPIIGWLPPTIAPAWLAYPTTYHHDRAFVLWVKPPKDPDIMCIAPDCTFVWVNQPPDSTLDIRGPARWVIAVGHINDPAADRCHWVWPEDWEVDPSYDDADAVATCRRAFVLEAIEDD